MRVHGLQVLRRLPHPGRGFTQGLLLDGETVWESTGRYGRSALSRYRLGGGQPWESAPLPPELFGEGICRAGEHIWQLTWRERVALRWDPRTLTVVETVPYNREGWGICSTGNHILTSDGTSELVRRDTETLQPTGTVVRVRCAGERLAGLNDLDWSSGRVWANIAAKPYLAGIDPDSGEVTDLIDARAAHERHWGNPEAILNGVTALPADGEFLLTGKGWRHLYHVRLAEGGSRSRSALERAGIPVS
ncbi:MAG TPA: glutaminyl-peptide cyclotransferase [Streptosporangiaceae bacterium]|nr:glutaminyl-peptide cyclotransferase [Streptosporangiaceae bacterium]